MAEEKRFAAEIKTATGGDALVKVAHSYDRKTDFIQVTAFVERNGWGGERDWSVHLTKLEAQSLGLAILAAARQCKEAVK